MNRDDLARWLVAQPWWEWRPGMVVEDYGVVCHDCASRGIHQPGPRHRPNLTDPATIGALVGMARDAYNGAIVVSIGNGWWSVETDEHEWDHDNTASLAEALGKAIAARRSP